MDGTLNWQRGRGFALAAMLASFRGLAAAVVLAAILAPAAAWAGSTTTTVASSVNPSFFGQSVTFTATVMGSGGTPTGTVTFKDGSTPLGTGTLSGGTASFPTAALTAGTHSITAVYGGDSKFSGSISPPLNPNQVVKQASTATQLSSSQSTINAGQSVTFTATVTVSQPGAGSPTGTVTFKDGTTMLGTGTVSGGTASFTTAALVTAGTHSITATYGGDSNFLGSTSAETLTVNALAAGIALKPSLNPSTAGQAVTFTATVTESSVTPTGTVTFKEDGATIGGPVTLSGGAASFTTSTLTVGVHSISAVYSGDGTYNGGTAAFTQLVRNASTTALTSSLNPSAFNQAVTFTATVTGVSPTGTVTFKDGGAVIGTGTVNGAGVAPLTISTLAVGNHSITATYNGDAGNGASTSPVLNQSVAVPADSVKLRALQITVTQTEANASGAAISGAVDGAISDGFSESVSPVVASDNSVRFNFAAVPQENALANGQKQQSVGERVGDAFDALSYARGANASQANVYKAPPRLVPQNWLAWAEVRGTEWSTSVQAGDIRGGQTNALLGVTRRLSPNFLLGVFGGYEGFDYTSQLLTGRLKGEGWTAGTYLGWQLTPGLRFDASVARSGVSYDGVAGTADGSFPGQRWLASAALIGTIKTMGFDIEPSAKVYALWEHDNTYSDSLGILQNERNFSTGRASVGAKMAYPWLWSTTATVAPYAGVYADYYFNQDDAMLPAAATPLLLPTEFVHGFSARVTSGIGVDLARGPKFSLGGEVGGLGSGQFTNWTVRGRAAVPF